MEIRILLLIILNQCNNSMTYKIRIYICKTKINILKWEQMLIIIISVCHWLITNLCYKYHRCKIMLNPINQWYNRNIMILFTITNQPRINSWITNHKQLCIQKTYIHNKEKVDFNLPKTRYSINLNKCSRNFIEET